MLPKEIHSVPYIIAFSLLLPFKQVVINETPESLPSASLERMDTGVVFHLCSSVILNAFDLVIGQMLRQIGEITPVVNDFLAGQQVLVDSRHVVSDVCLQELFEWYFGVLCISISKRLKLAPIGRHFIRIFFFIYVLTLSYC